MLSRRRTTELVACALGLLAIAAFWSRGPDALSVRARSTSVVAALHRWVQVEVAIGSPSNVTFSVRPADSADRPVVEVTRRVSDRYVFEWRGREQTGGSVPDGRYEVVVSLSTGGERLTRRVGVRVSNAPGAPDSTAPPPPSGLVVVAAQQNALAWSPVTAPDAVYYRVYRSAARRGEYSLVGTSGVEGMVDLPPTKGVYWYRVGAVDLSGNEGEASREVSSDNVHLTQTVGPSGGTLDPTTGTVRLEIPSGAVEAPTTLTIDQIATPPPPDVNRVLVSRVFDLGPAGTTFKPPAVLSLRYVIPSRYPLPSKYPADATWAEYWDPAAGTWIRLRGGSVDTATSTIRAAIPHLSVWAGASVTVPHGGYSNQTQLCGYCHQAHRSPGDHLFQRASERETCYQCHDGTGASTNIRADFGESTIGSSTRVSFHPVPTARDGIRLACSDCHTAHKLMAADTKLLRVRAGGSYLYSPPSSPIGNAFCYACHGSGSSLPAPFGDFSPFQGSAHDTTVAGPPSGSGIKCLACHAPHGSDYHYLTRANQEQVCFGCHNRATPNTSGGSDPQLAFTAQANDYTTSDGTPVRIFHHPIDASEQAGGTRSVECVSCHNPHIADRQDSYGSKLVDPANTNSKWFVWWQNQNMTRGNIGDWCEKCHVSPSTTRPIPPGPGVPYPVALTNDTAPDAGGQPHDLFDSWDYNNRSKHGPRGAGLACTACHDFHGSSNAYMIRENVVSPDGSSTHTIQGFQATDSVSDWESFKWLCITCHQDALGHANEKLAGGHVCRECHYHTSENF